MKKRLLSVILAAVLMTSFLPVVPVSAEENVNTSGYQTVTFGSYPQSRVTDEATIAALDAIEKEWVSYGYYSEMEPDDYMRYADFEYKGVQYRAVVFDAYRPYVTSEKAINSSDVISYQDSYRQYINGFRSDTVYYFAYEPLKWKVLDPVDGLLLSEKAIDSQAFKSYVVNGYFGDDENTHRANDYEYSDIRAWMNADFYDLAFNAQEKQHIRTTHLKNRNLYSSSLDGNDTDDKVFLLSHDDVINTEYGFAEDPWAQDSARRIEVTDYAKAQGCYVNTTYGTANSCWLRSGYDYNKVAGFGGSGVSPDSNGNAPYYTTSSIVPAITITDIGSICNHNYFCSDSSKTVHTYICSICGNTKTELHSFDINGNCDCGFIKKAFENGDIIKIGSYPQSKVSDGDLIAELNRIDKEWVSYGYYSGTASVYDGFIGMYNGEMKSYDYMKYCDIDYNGEKYRAVLFTKYRPKYTGISNDSGEPNGGNFGYEYQSDYGYYKDTIYYFKHTPIKWRLLNRITGLLLCEESIDTQPFYNYVTNDMYTDNDQNNYVSSWCNSDLRRFLNDDFYNTAFSTQEKEMIKTTHLQNNSPNDNKYDGEETDDNVYLLSWDDIVNADYGFTSIHFNKDLLRVKISTDYACCQGAWKSPAEDKFGRNAWWLRSAWSHFEVAYVDAVGSIGNYGFNVIVTNTGIAPAISVDVEKLSDTFGVCGNNAEWNYDKNIGKLSITGSGATDSLESFDDYGWYSFKDSIKYVEISDGITSLGANAFNGCTALEEVYCGESLTAINENAFADCTSLATVTFTSSAVSAAGAFSNNSPGLCIVYNGNNEQAKQLAAALAARAVPYTLSEEQILSFNGEVHVNSRQDYHFPSNLLNKYKKAEYLHFNKLIFDDIIAKEILVLDDEINVDYSSKKLALTDVYINLAVVIDGHERNISFEKMIELLENGEYDAFKIKINSEEEGTEQTIFQKIEAFFSQISTSLIKAVSKAINFFVKIFKRK